MRDIGGFAALLLIIFVVMYVAVRYVIPFVLLYSAGALSFFIVAGILIRRGLRHPVHLDSCLKPGFAPAALIISLVLPCAHAATLWLTGLSDHWAAIGIANLALPLVWTGRLLLRHIRQSRRFVREGHDMEEVIEGSRDRAGLLDLKIELLAAVDQSRRTSEPWEVVAGLADGNDSGLVGSIGQLTMDMKQLRAGYSEIAASLQLALDSLRAGGARPTDWPDQLARFSELDALWSRVSREVSAILDESTGYSPAGWD